jgi:hypothetical protein
MFDTRGVGAEALERPLPGEEWPASDNVALCFVAFNPSGYTARDGPSLTRLTQRPVIATILDYV